MPRMGNPSDGLSAYRSPEAALTREAAAAVFIELGKLDSASAAVFIDLGKLGSASTNFDRVA